MCSLTCCTFYTGKWITCLPNWQLTGFNWQCFEKPLMIHGQKPPSNAQHNHCLVRDFPPHSTHNHTSTCRCQITAVSHSLKLYPTSLENATKLMAWQHNMEIKPSCMMLPKIHLFAKALLPWTPHHQTTVQLNKTVSNLPYTARTPTLNAI